MAYKEGTLKGRFIFLGSDQPLVVIQERTTNGSDPFSVIQREQEAAINGCL